MNLEDYIELNNKQYRGKAAASEHDLQVICVNVFRMLYPKYSHLLMAIPNGGYRSKTTARTMKAEGQLAGVPDMFLAVPINGYHGMWIEMKNGKAGRVSDLQKEMMERLSNQGYMCYVCRTTDEFIEAVKNYLGK